MECASNQGSLEPQIRGGREEGVEQWVGDGGGGWARVGLRQGAAQPHAGIPRRYEWSQHYLLGKLWCCGNSKHKFGHQHQMSLTGVLDWQRGAGGQVCGGMNMLPQNHRCHPK